MRKRDFVTVIMKRFGLIFAVGGLLTLAPFGALLPGGPALAMGICERLEAELNRAAAQTGPGLVRHHTGAVERQRVALKEAERMARRNGCDRQSGRQTNRCRAIASTLNAMASNLRSLERRAGNGAGNRQGIRRIKALMHHHRCNARPVARRSGGLFGIFNGDGGQARITRGVPDEPQRSNRHVRDSRYNGYSSYRTVCVRTCDGYFFPVSFATYPGQFDQDAQKCASMCGGTKTELFVFRLPDETLKDARTVSGKAYSDLPDAFRFQKEFVKGCSCQARQATAMLDSVKAQQHAAKTAPPGDADTTGEPAATRQAKTDIRDVFKQPGIDRTDFAGPDETAERAFPPLPPKRPRSPEHVRLEENRSKI